MALNLCRLVPKVIDISLSDYLKISAMALSRDSDFSPICWPGFVHTHWGAHGAPQALAILGRAPQTVMEGDRREKGKECERMEREGKSQAGRYGKRRGGKDKVGSLWPLKFEILNPPLMYLLICEPVVITSRIRSFNDLSAANYG